MQSGESRVVRAITIINESGIASVNTAEIANYNSKASGYELLLYSDREHVTLRPMQDTVSC